MASFLRPAQALARAAPFARPNANPDYTTVALAKTPLHYWPLDEVIGTTCRDLVSTGNRPGTVVGSVLVGGELAPGALGGRCATFNGGTGRIELGAKILGGLNDYTIAAWVRIGDLAGAQRTWYSERNPTTGNNEISARVQGGERFQHTYAPDVGIRASNPSSIAGKTWRFLCMTRSGINHEVWWDGGRRSLSTNVPASNTWTNTGVVAYIGNDPRATATQGWMGAVSHLLLFDRVLTSTEIWDLFKAATPIRRRLIKATDWVLGKPFAANAWCNQRLVDGSMNQVATIHPNSVTWATRFAALAGQQAGWFPQPQTGLGPVYVVDSTTPVKAVRIEGNQNNFGFNEPQALYNALRNIPMPDHYATGTNTDHSSIIYSPPGANPLYPNGAVWDFWNLAQELIRPSSVSVVPSTGGALPAGSYRWDVGSMGGDRNPGGTIGWGANRTSSTLTLAAGSQVSITWQVPEGAQGFWVRRTFNNVAGPFVFITTNPGNTVFVDDGAIPNGLYPAVGLVPPWTDPAHTADWGCQHGGACLDMLTGNGSLGTYESPRASWGTSAGSVVSSAGMITIEEGLAAAEGNIDAIQHATAMAWVEAHYQSFMWPAKRTDGISTRVDAMPMGGRWQLDPTFNAASVPTNFGKAVAKALQVFGAVHRDGAGGNTICYVEDHSLSGRAIYARMYGGQTQAEVLQGIPFTDATKWRVIDPAWSKTQAGL